MTEEWKPIFTFQCQYAKCNKEFPSSEITIYQSLDRIKGLGYEDDYWVNGEYGIHCPECGIRTRFLNVEYYNHFDSDERKDYGERIDRKMRDIIRIFKLKFVSIEDNKLVSDFVNWQFDEKTLDDLIHFGNKQLLFHGLTYYFI